MVEKIESVSTLEDFAIVITKVVSNYVTAPDAASPSCLHTRRQGSGTGEFCGWAK
jgi:hypothetical protein